MWRDPLDELIEKLEEVSAPAADSWHTTFLALTTLTDVVLYGTEEEKARVHTDPRVQPVFAWARRMRADRVRGAEAAKGGDSPPKSAEEPSAATADERSSADSNDYELDATSGECP
jgi:hypothetical protein